MQKAIITVKCAEGFHVRPAMQFYQTAIRYCCQVSVIKDGIKYNGKSMLDLISMCVTQGDSFQIIVEGLDENEAITALLEQLQIDDY